MESGVIRAQVERILRSKSFASKGQLRKLLEVLSKNIDSQSVLSPDLVIRELWPDEVRTKRSADVATEMNRLRHALEAYYNEEGNADPITISLPNRAAADGAHEKRWIVAKPREAGQERTGNPLPSQGMDPRRGPKKTALIVVSSVALGILAYASFRLLAAPDQPKLGQLDGSALVILNAEGKELWRKVFPQGFGPEWYYKRGLTSHIWFADLEGKGHTSVLFAYAPAGPLSQSSTLICYSDRGKEKWRWTPGRSLPEFGGSPPTFATVALRILKATEKRTDRIIVSSQLHPWWPCQIAALDSDGKLVSEYWHSGLLDSLVLADLDGDGREEIVATGISIGYHQATLVVLDPDKLFGASVEAARPDLQMGSMGVAQERLRLLFPRSDLNKALFQFNAAAQPTIDHGNVRLEVWECLTPDLSCAIWYEFEKGFHLGSAYAGGDDFHSAHDRFYQTRKDAHPLSAQEQAAFLKVRCLVGCDSEFVPIGNLVPKSAHK